MVLPKQLQQLLLGDSPGMFGMNTEGGRTTNMSLLASHHTDLSRHCGCRVVATCIDIVNVAASLRLNEVVTLWYGMFFLEGSVVHFSRQFGTRTLLSPSSAC